MTGRILWIELRRSAAAGVALLSLAVTAALLLAFAEEFAGRWIQLAVSARLLLIVWWPLALAGGAWLGLREARSRVGELFASTVRPRWQRVAPTAAALAVALVAGYALMVLAGAVLVVPTAGYFPPGAVALVAVGALSLPAAGWLGMAAARAVPRMLTPPALAVVGLAAVGLLPEWLATRYVAGGDAPPVVLLTPVFGGALSDIHTVATRLHLLQAVWLVALAATGLLLLGAASRRAAAAATLPALLGAAVVLPFLPAGGYEAAARVDPAAAALVCDDDGPPVCVTRVHAALLPGVTGPAREALGSWRSNFPAPPPGRSRSSTRRTGCARTPPRCGTRPTRSCSKRHRSGPTGVPRSTESSGGACSRRPGGRTAATSPPTRPRTSPGASAPPG